VNGIRQRYMNNKTLKTQRQHSAEASGGISNESIYKLFERTLMEFDLKGDLLDFGAGTGHLIQRLQKLKRFRITTTDLMDRPSCLDDSIKWFRADLNEPIGTGDNSFDVIVSAEVIEHLENPRAVIREWFRLLRPGGKLIFSTPNNESWRSILALLWRGHFVMFGDTCYPAHITAILRKDIQRILQEVGFCKPVFIFSNSGGIPKLPQITWQSISFGLFKGMRFSDNLLVLTEKPS